MALLVRDSLWPGSGLLTVAGSEYEGEGGGRGHVVQRGLEMKFRGNRGPEVSTA